MKRKTRFTFNHELTFSPTRPQRPVRWLFLALLFPLIGVALAHALSRHATPPVMEPGAVPAATEAPAVEPAMVPATAPEEPPGSKVDVVVRPDDTLEGIFRQLRLSAADLNAALMVPGVRQGFTPLKPGDKFTVVHDGAAVHAINRRVSETEVFSVTRGENGFAAEVITVPVETQSPPVRGNDPVEAKRPE